MICSRSGGIVGVAFGRRHRCLAHVLVRDRDRRVARERRDAGDHLVEHDAERVHVAATVDGKALRLLGREVGGGAHHRTGLGEPVARAGARDAEVGDLHVARSGQQHVAGLHVAVHDAVAVRERERGRDLGGDLGGLVRVDRRLGADEVAQRSAFDVLHHDEVRAVLLAPVVDRDDVGVVEVRGGLRLAAEALDERRLARVLGEQRLQRDRPVQQLVVREVDLGHPALRELALDLVAVRKDPAGQRHGGENPICRSSGCRVARRTATWVVGVVSNVWSTCFAIGAATRPPVASALRRNRRVRRAPRSRTRVRRPARTR